jgi:hypothetical protein
MNGTPEPPDPNDFWGLFLIFIVLVFGYLFFYQVSNGIIYGDQGIKESSKFSGTAGDCWLRRDDLLRCLDFYDNEIDRREEVSCPCPDSSALFRGASLSF